MKSALMFLTVILWALWFGGTMATFLFAGYFFSTLPRDIAGQAANAMFHGFTIYELVLAALIVISTGITLAAVPTGKIIFNLGILILASGMAVTFGLGFIPMMDSLRHEGKVNSLEFDRYHHRSVIALDIQAALLLISGGVIALSIKDLKPPETTQEIVEA